MTLQPRPYQKDAINSVLDRYQNGQRQLLLRLPTGAGKTVISALLIAHFLDLCPDLRVLFLAHRREIIDQTAEKIQRLVGEQNVSVEQAGRASTETRVVVASIQTMTLRLDSFDPDAFALVIIDECHHAFAKSWMDVIGHFGRNVDSLLLGLTATPKRSDGRCVTSLFPETAYEISLGALQDSGFLVPMSYYTLEASLGLGDAALDRHGDFQSNILAKIMNTPEMRMLALKACREKARGRKTIAFCASVGHAEDLAEDFRASGIAASCVSGESSDRDAVIRDFREGLIQILTNFGVLTEGFDDPGIECVLLARPTTSPLIYSQCLGRGLRSHPGKSSCIVIDVVDRQRHQLQYNAFEAAGLPRSWQGSGKDPLREAEAIARIRVSDPTAFLKLRNALSLADTQQILMGLDPNTVFAGIDGMPLLRYPERGEDDPSDSEELRSLALGLLRAAGWPPEQLAVAPPLIEAVFRAADGAEPSPYLSWHLKQATGLQLECLILPEAKAASRNTSSAGPTSVRSVALRRKEPAKVEAAKAEPVKATPETRLDLRLRMSLLKSRRDDAPSVPPEDFNLEPKPKTGKELPRLSMQERLRAITDQSRHE